MTSWGGTFNNLEMKRQTNNELQGGISSIWKVKKWNSASIIKFAVTALETLF